MNERMQHKPVLLHEVREALSWDKPIAFWDATVGLGGHSLALLSGSVAPALYVASDQDAQALHQAEKRLRAALGSDTLCRFMHVNFSEVAEKPLQRFDRILIDLGVSSYQLDDASRGFSFQKDGPLDMRMDPSRGEPVGQWLLHCSEDELLSVLRENEVSPPRVWARRWITARRKSEELQGSQSPLKASVMGSLSTRHFVEAMGFRLDSKDHRGRHPLTLFFQALRIHINRERQHLESLMTHLPNLLNPDGRVAIISFHSQEDRLVKWSLRGRLEAINKKVIVASTSEQDNNPRSRSAKLRVYRK